MNAAQKATATSNLSLVIHRNKIINSLGSINQRGVSGTVTLAAFAYGHDRFRAGASGCTYTFSTTNGVTTFYISTGTLQQVIEASAFAGEADTYYLGWTGTAQGRINGGSYGASGAVSAACDGSANVTVEWNPGTLVLPQFERGYIGPFSARPIQQELALCQRYCLAIDRMFGAEFSTTASTLSVGFPVEMRAAPTGVATTLVMSSLQVVGAGPASGLASLTSVTATTKLLRVTVAHNAIGAIGQPVDAVMSGYISAEL